MKKEDLAYVAGFFDGEGCVFVTTCSHPKYTNGYNLYLALVIGNTNRVVLEWLLDKFGGKIYEHKGRDRRKSYWHWQLQRRHTLAFLKGVLPYLKIKKEQAQLAVEFQAYKFYRGRTPCDTLERQEEIRRELQRLKKL